MKNSHRPIAGSGDVKPLREKSEDYAKGYRMGLRTGMEFVMKYCTDYLDAMEKKG